MLFGWMCVSGAALRLTFFCDALEKSVNQINKPPNYSLFWVSGCFRLCVFWCNGVSTYLSWVPLWLIEPANTVLFTGGGTHLLWMAPFLLIRYFLVLHQGSACLSQALPQLMFIDS